MAQQKNSFTFIDLFAGIGGFRIGFEKVGGKCVFSSEIDPFSRKTYKNNFGEEPSGDINEIKINAIPKHDLLLGGFPCQPFSLAGVSKKNSLGREHGFRDKTQGTLFFKIAEILEIKRPAAFLLENVKNLTGHDGGKTFKTILQTFEELGYEYNYKILDAKCFVPQHRERIYIVGFDKSLLSENLTFEFPDFQKTGPVLSSILQTEYDKKYIISDKLWNWHQDYAKKHKSKGNGFGYGLADGNSITRTLSARYHKDGAEILVHLKNSNPRKLTPRECARLMGFPDSFQITVSDTQAYRQFGNSVVVPMVSEIADSMLRYIKKYGLLSKAIQKSLPSGIAK